MQESVGTAQGINLFLAVWRRRKWLALLIFTALFAATAVIVTGLPDTYEAGASVLVEQQVPERFTGPSVVGEFETRLHTISQEILSRSRLYGLIVQFGLYPDLRGTAPPEALAEQMRRDIRLEFTEMPQPWVGRQATIAFTIRFRGEDPQTVPKVANALAALFIERNASIRERQTTGTVGLLRAQLDQVKRKLAEQERRISEFKVRHSGELPEHQHANLEAVRRLGEQLRLNIDMQLRLMERRDALSRPAPEPLPAPVAGMGLDETSAELTRLRKELASLRSRFTDEHPDVIQMKAQIAELESRSPVIPPQTTHPVRSEPRQPPESARKVEAELAALRAQERSLRSAMSAYERRVTNSPLREQQLQQISRDYEATKELYQSLLERYEEAQLSEQVQQGSYGEQFRILDPAVPPQYPVAPSRVKLLIMGMMLAGAMAGGAALLAEALDTSFHSLDDLRAFTTVPVLASVPPIVTASDSRRQRRRFALAAVASLTAIVGVTGAAFLLSRDGGFLVQILAMTGLP